MPLSLLKAKNHAIPEIHVDAFVSVTSIDTHGILQPVFEHEDEESIRSVCNKFNNLQAIKTGKIVIDESKLKDRLYLVQYLFGLSTKRVINVIAPTYIDGEHGEEALLRSCYIDALNLAKSYNCENILFPLIASKAYKYPQKEAVAIAIRAINDWLTSNDMEIILLVFDKNSLSITKQLRNNIDEFIDNHYIFKCHSKYQGFFGKIRAFFDKLDEETIEKSGRIERHEPIIFYSEPPSEERRRKDIERALEASFSSSLMKLIETKGKNPTDVYKRANIDRKLFSKIRSEKDYFPSKRTAIALAIALELSLEETNNILKRAGFVLSHSILFDVIIEYFITNKKYDIFEINNVLFEYNQPVLGG